MISFLWSNWSWLASIGVSGLGAAAWFMLGRRGAAWALWALAGLFVIYALYGAASDYVQGERDAATNACNLAHKVAGWKAESDARAAIRASEEAAYRKGLADTQHRADDAAARESETETVIREVTKTVPAACVFDAAAAAKLNALRRDP